MLLTLLPLAPRVGDGGLDHATPQEAAVLLDQVRQVEALLRPRAALALDKVCFCRQIRGFGDCEPWPPDHVFQPENDDRRGERIQVYGEVRNFTCRPRDGAYEMSLAGVVEIRDFANHVACRIDFPAGVERSQTPRQDYFINFPFHLPRLPEGRTRCTCASRTCWRRPATTPPRARRPVDRFHGGRHRSRGRGARLTGITRLSPRRARRTAAR